LKKFAVIVAAGLGTRMGSEVPKQFMLLNGKSVLWYTLRAFLKAYDDMQIILVLHKEHGETGKAIAGSLNAEKRITITAGGETRFHSVKNGLRFVESPSVVFVHDGVRCLITEKLIHACYGEALAKGNAIPSVKPVDSLRIDTDGGNEVLDRNKVNVIQTPQTFLSEIILTAFDRDYDESFTDEATVAEKMGVKINLVSGETNNIKITKPGDLMLAESFLSINYKD
jgi:2-C-methyl-D-erythritol 4-phosphate cytidylyltransferase